MRPHRWLVALVSRLVPKDLRLDWRAEWDAELSHRESATDSWARGRGSRAALFRHSTGAVWDALWLQASRWYSLRLFGRQWRLALSALLSLSVAIAATVVGLSTYNVLLLRPPGVHEPDTLRLINVGPASQPYGEVSFPDFTAYRERTRAFAGIAAYPYSVSTFDLVDGDRTARIISTQVSANFFQVLGITPVAGTVAFETDAPGEGADLLISERLWRTLGSDPHLVGRTVRVNDQPLIVTGIVPDRFTGMTWAFVPEAWMSLETAAHLFNAGPDEFTRRSNPALHLVGRLAPTVTEAQATADAESVAASIEREHPDTNKGVRALLTPLSVTPPGDRQWARLIVGALLLVVLLTLVVACANVTNLLLGLAASRRHEMLVRAALGASRLQLVLPLVRQSAVLGLLSGLLGYAIASVALVKLMSFHPSVGGYLPSFTFDLRPDAVVLVATLVIAIVAGIAVGLPPALRGASEGLSGSLTREQATAEPRRTRIRQTLLAMQMVVATVVLVGVGVAVRSLVSLHGVDLGFSARDLAYCGIDVARTGYTDATGPAFYERLREHLAATPGIEAVALASEPPLSGYGTEHVLAPGDPPPAGGHGPETPYLVVDDQYFATIGMRVLRGRAFDSRDRAGSTEVAVVNETLARRHWPSADPIGQQLRVETGNRLVEIVGVVPDGKYGDVDEDPLPMLYLALPQHYRPVISVVARTRAPRDTLLEAISDVAPNLVFGGAGLLTLGDMLGLSTLLPRLVIWTTMGLGAVALMLAVFGLYSTVFYAVSQRRLEIGIRTALGATPADLFRLALGDSAWVAIGGGVSGLGVGLALVPVAASLFFGIHGVEPLVIAGAATAVSAVVLIATYAVVRPWTRRAATDLLRR